MDSIELPPLVKRQKESSHEHSSLVVNRSVRRTPITYKTTRLLPIAKDKLQQHVILPGSQQSACQAYKFLRTQVLKIMQENHWQTLGIISPKPQEGKTLTALNLAISLSQDEKHTVLLADFNLKQPGIVHYLSHAPEYYLEDVMLHDLPLEQALINPMIDGLVMLPSRGGQINTSEILMSSMMDSLIMDVRQRYTHRLLVVDLPSALDTDDVLAVSKHIDAFLVVVADGKSTVKDLEKTLQLMSDTNVIGTVLNQHIE